MSEPQASSQDVTETEIRYRGLAVSRGVAVGPLRFQGQPFQRPRRWPITEVEVQGEETRFEEALRRTRGQIEQLQEQLLKTDGNHAEARVFDAHLLVLEDQTVISDVRKRLHKDRFNVESIYYEVIRRYVESLKAITDPYLRERAVDIEDVAGRVLVALADADDNTAMQQSPRVLFADDLAPSDTVGMDRSLLLGFATRLGSFTSHTAIMARALGIPGVVGLKIPPGTLRAGREVILDGFNGILITDPTEETLEEYRKLAEQQDVLNQRLDQLRAEPAETHDGARVVLSANIEFGHEVDAIMRRGADGVGLYRTEFFYYEQDRHPDEEQQTAAYSAVAEKVGDAGVIIRTLDVGADKFQTADGRLAEKNPFLGWRGIRVSLQETELFKTQLRACLRASARGNVRLMYPMISGVEELVAANGLLEECQAELRREGVPFDEDMEVGCMIELPSAVMVAPELAKEVDFFSVGTNDLIQYTIAVDRVNERVADLYQPGHPAILRLLEMVVEAAHDADIWVGVCGEMAGDPLFTPVLVGLGVDELSVGPSQILRVKHALRQLDSLECEVMVKELLRLPTVEEVMNRCRALAKERYGEFYQ